ncbi:MAG: M23 family metallopeptidase [Acidimicrobiia bacterium]
MALKFVWSQVDRSTQAVKFLLRHLMVTGTVLVTLVALAIPALAADFDPNNIVFPVGGDSYYTDTFDSCRGGSGCPRRHEATDILTYGVKGVPVVAAAAGTVEWIGSTCCLLKIDHRGGWATQYIHLNNDTQNPDGSYGDDGQGYGIAPGIQVGTQVEAGQLIGWVGDSGNAEGTAPHLHFEIWKDGARINPYSYLLDAQAGWTGNFSDDDYSVHEVDIDKIFVEGITIGCSLNNEFCPERNITRGEMAAFITRALGLSVASGVPAYTDVGGHLFEGEIDRIQTAGIGFGCTETEYCPDRPLERDEMAELLVRAFGYENPDGTDFFNDDDGNPFEESINKLASAGITLGCDPQDNARYCPDRLLSRAEMASFFVRALGL